MKNRVRVHLKGGLGNQLFQYYAGLHLSLIRNQPLELELISIEHGRNPHDSRIDSLNLSGCFKYTKHRYSFSLLARSIRSWLEETNSASVLGILKIIHKTLNLYTSPDTGFDPELSRKKTTRKIEGYFQTWRYFHEVKSLKPHLVVNLEPRDLSPYLRKMITDVRQKKTLVMHVRRGDYISGKETFGLLSTRYYEQAINKLRVNGISWDQAWVFTDDIKSTHAELKDLIESEGLRVIETPPGSSSIEDLYIMSEASSIIIANSTFSWWAATLGVEKDAIACPTKWFRNLNDPKDLYPDHWIKVSSSWKE
jgi:hypothetical protein